MNNEQTKAGAMSLTGRLQDGRFITLTGKFAVLQAQDGTTDYDGRIDELPPEVITELLTSGYIRLAAA